MNYGKPLAILFIAFAVLGTVADKAWGTDYPSKNEFQARFYITSVNTNDSNASWRLIGTVDDSSMMGYSLYDATTNDLVYCLSYLGDADRYRITNIVSRLGFELTCDVVYDFPSGEPVSGGPTSGDEIICRDQFLPSTTYGASEALQNSARNIKEKGFTNSIHYLELATNSLNLSKVSKTGDSMSGLLEANAGITVSNTLTVISDLVLTPVEQLLTNGATINAAGRNYIYVRGSNEAVEALASPQITAGTLGKILTIEGRDSTYPVTITNGNSISLSEQVSFTMGSNNIIQLVYDGTLWIEVHRDAKQ